MYTDGDRMKPRIPANEEDRLAALREYRILDTLPEAAYDDITLLASQICAAPIALITMVDADRQWFKSRIGLDLVETPRDVSFCAHAILEADLVEVPDTTKDARFADNPFVTEASRFRFYAAAPLVTSEGLALGTLCVLDRVPRQLTPGQQASLRALARQTMAQLERGRQLRHLEILTRELGHARDETRERAQRAARYHAVLMELARLDKSDVATAIRTMTERVAEALRVSRVSVWMFDAHGASLTCSNLFDARTSEHSSGQRLDAEAYPGYFAAMQERRVIVANDARTDPCTREFAGHYLEPNGITSMLDVPIWRGGRVTGIVCHEHTKSAREWSAEEQDFAVSVADVVTLALEAHDRRQAELALRASETSYRALFDLSNDAIYVHDVDTGAVVDVNRKACDEHGYSREELARLDLGRLSAQSDGYTQERLLVYFRAAADGDPQIFEWLEVTRAGRRMWKEITLRRVDINGIPRLLATARDITEQKRGAEALKQAHENLERRVIERTAELARVNAALHAEIHDRERAERELQRRTTEIERREAHFRLLIEYSSDIASILDERGIVRYQSPSVQRVLGYTPEELTNVRSFDYVQPGDVAEAGRVFQELLASPAGESRSIEFRFRHKDGSWRVLESIGRTLPEDSPYRGVVLNSRDVTERRGAEEAAQCAIQEAEEARESAERANRAKSEFLSRMSHELRTPMNSILGFAQLLARKDLPPDQRKGVDHILKAGRHLLNLINEVLDIARIETDRQPFSLEPVNVEAMLNEALNLIRPLAAQYECRIQDIDTVDPAWHVRADRQRLAQVMLNLLSNAVKYNRPGGTVRVSCEPARERERPVLRIHVHDTGPGIAADKLEQLFTPFERLGAEQTNVEGTGLGLALSKRLVEAMGGVVVVRSQPGEGSTFTLTLPVSRSPLEKVRRDGGLPAAPDHVPARPARILYIEDNLANLTLIESILGARPGYTLIPALQGRLGLDLAWEHAPDLIMLDVHLPDMPGDEVLARLRADARTAQTPVLVISADAMPGREDRLLNGGAQAFLTKPLDVDRFLGTLDRLLREPATT
jgi:PAS domain S-box-containing protein